MPSAHLSTWKGGPENCHGVSDRAEALRVIIQHGLFASWILIMMLRSITDATGDAQIGRYFEIF